MNAAARIKLVCQCGLAYSVCQLIGAEPCRTNTFLHIAAHL